jgi:hypothetical protein
MPSTSPSQGVCRTSEPLTEGPEPTSHLGSLPAPHVASRCSPVGFDRQQVFKKKFKPDGTIDKYNAQLVAKGYTQKEGEDFFDTYSPVARLTIIRVLLSLATSHGLCRCLTGCPPRDIPKVVSFG